ncbi:MAG: glycosyl hydrolase family 95 catalytic domain-containing protein [Planctomycetota bacterium]|jgi:alpha-L-fucosidase 2
MRNLATWAFVSCLAGIVIAEGVVAGEGFKLSDNSPIYEAAPVRALDLTDEVTLEVWVKADRMDRGGGRILDKSVPGTSEAFMLDTYPGNSLRLITLGGQCRYDAKLSADRWRYVAAVYSSSKRVMKLYLDGAEVASAGGDFPPMSKTSVPLRVGADPSGANRFRGRILRAAVYSRALTEDEIAARSRGGKAPGGVVGEWEFAEKPGRKIEPVSGKLALALAGSGAGAELAGEAPPPEGDLVLWYRRPAVKWTEALPVGNGRLGAMVFGGVPNGRIQFNEDSLWNGEPHYYHRPDAHEHLAELRQLLFDGKQREAHKLGMSSFMSVPLRQMKYQPFGDIVITTPQVETIEGYRRELDLDSALARVTYRSGGVTFTREVFSSFPDQVIVVRLAADRPGALDFTARLKSPHSGYELRAAGENRLVLSGKVRDGALRFEAEFEVRAEGGRVELADESATVSGADAATLVLAAATSYVNYRDVSADPHERCEERLAAVADKSYDALRAAHTDDHQRLFRRVSLDLGRTAAAAKETDVRVVEFKGGDDPHLAALLFQYGRYLLIGSSRAGSQPANLQGIWNESLKPPWDSKWTVNINTEMNYWPAEPTGLGDCVEPLVDMLADCAETGAKTARGHYDCGGWVLHHNTDVWRGTAPINNSNHGIWVVGGAWLCQHLWWHYEYTGDKEYLRERAYPIMKGAAEFFTEFLIEDPRAPEKKWLISGPSNSPEQGGLVMAPTMDHQIIRGLFSDCIAASEVLGVDEDFRAKLADMRARIAPNLIGRHGQLQEWLEDKDSPGNKHRHVSHMWGLHPGREITPATPELFAAVKKSLEFRGDGGTGWSMGWKVNLWARLLDGDHAYLMLSNQLSPGRTAPNLFCLHPPFQIDGNFGAASGIVEMLLQSQNGEVHLLPALPSVWKKGRVTGLRAVGGFDVNISWEDGKLAKARVRSRLGGPLRVRYGGKTAELETARGGVYLFDGELGRLKAADAP